MSYRPVTPKAWPTLQAAFLCVISGLEQMANGVCGSIGVLGGYAGDVIGFGMDILEQPLLCITDTLGFIGGFLDSFVRDIQDGFRRIGGQMQEFMEWATRPVDFVFTPLNPYNWPTWNEAKEHWKETKALQWLYVLNEMAFGHLNSPADFIVFVALWYSSFPRIGMDIFLDYMAKAMLNSLAYTIGSYTLNYAFGTAERADNTVTLNPIGTIIGEHTGRLDLMQYITIAAYATGFSSTGLIEDWGLIDFVDEQNQNP